MWVKVLYVSKYSSLLKEKYCAFHYNICWLKCEINGLIHSQQGWVPKGNQWFSIWKSKQTCSCTSECKPEGTL